MLVEEQGEENTRGSVPEKATNDNVDLKHECVVIYMKRGIETIHTICDIWQTMHSVVVVVILFPTDIQCT